jgi:hypothetical protein
LEGVFSDLIRGRVLLNVKVYEFLTGPMKEELVQMRVGGDYEIVNGMACFIYNKNGPLLTSTPKK